MAEKTEDLNLPVACVARIMKDALPDGVLVSKEARLAIARAASVFVLYATSTAHGFAQTGKRKTLIASDVLDALKDMDLEDFMEPLKESLEAWKTNQKSKKSNKSASGQRSLNTSLDDAAGGEDAEVELIFDGTNLDGSGSLKTGSNNVPACDEDS